MAAALTPHLRLEHCRCALSPSQVLQFDAPLALLDTVERKTLALLSLLAGPVAPSACVSSFRCCCSDRIVSRIAYRQQQHGGAVAHTPGVTCITARGLATSRRRRGAGSSGGVRGHRGLRGSLHPRSLPLRCLLPSRCLAPAERHSNMYATTRSQLQAPHISSTLAQRPARRTSSSRRRSPSSVSARRPSASST